MFCLTLLASCNNRQPVKIGFVAGLSGRVADLGVAGRNGAMLAIEQKNSSGGINGRNIELIVRDTEQNPEIAKRVMAELIDQKLELIIGPMTSSMAMAMVPLANNSGTILLSPTVTTNDLVGKDDNFLRVINTTTGYARKSARYQYEKLGHRRFAAIYDLSNKSYTESWLKDFRTEFVKLGGTIVKETGFQSGDNAIFLARVKELQATKPDVILIISNAVDAAMICQQVRKLAPAMPIVMSEWASTERFIELGGAATEGVTVTQFLNRNDISPRYQAFRKAYLDRFGQEPGFAGMASHDAANVALEALSARKPGDSLKNVIVSRKSFQCTQQAISIDRFGDADRKTYITVIRNGKFETVE
jgi:branched-chain amino acid transport system substrate-binding protein